MRKFLILLMAATLFSVATAALAGWLNDPAGRLGVYALGFCVMNASAAWLVLRLGR